MTTAAERWRDDLAAWAVPDEILAQAPASPWIHPVRMFSVDDEVPGSPSHQRAREALPDGGDVLDVGCGGGRASMALVPRAGRVVGVDARAEMLAAYAEAADRRGAAHDEVLGRWPDATAPEGDVVVCHHVLYDVADVVPFVQALHDHARRRVVVELSAVHPLAHLAPYWKRFWDLDRPEGPTAGDALEVLRSLGIGARIEEWDDDRPWGRLDPDETVRVLRTRLCLPASRDAEVADAIATTPDRGPRRTATLWWDV